MKKILITAPVHPLLLERLEAMRYQVLFEPTISYEDLLHKVEDVTGIVATTRIPIDKRMIQAAGRLEWIGRLGSGMELIDASYAETKGIRCFSTPEGRTNQTIVQGSKVY